MSKPKLALIPSGYKSGKVYSILPNDATGDFDYERNGNASRVRKDGLIEELTVDDTPRLDWLNSNCPSLLLEPQRINLQVNSEQFDNSLWTKLNTTIEANSIIGPNGELSADKMIGSSTSTSYIYDVISLSTSTTYSLSIFVKKGTSNDVDIDIWDSVGDVQGRVRFNLDTKTITNSTGTASFENYGNEWYRLKVSFTTDATLGTSYLRIFERTNVLNNYFYLFGAQVEQGSYVSSYIKTEASTVTRLKDECYINSGIDNIINTDEGTLYFEVETPRVSTSSDFDRVVLSDQTATTDRVIFDNFNGSWRVVLTSSAGTQTASIRSVQANTKIKVAFTYSASQIKVSYDGNDATTTSITYTPASTLESFKFSNAAGNGQFFQGKIHDVRYFDTVLSNAELKQLTL